jgi:hypothetical protein
MATPDTMLGFNRQLIIPAGPVEQATNIDITDPIQQLDLSPLHPLTLEEQYAQRFGQGVGMPPAAQVQSPAAPGAPPAPESSVAASQPDTLEYYKRLYPNWAGSPGGIDPREAAMMQATASNVAAQREKMAVEAETTGQTQQALSGEVGTQQALAAQEASDFAKRAEADTAERAEMARSYERMITKARAEYDKASKDVDPNRLLRGGRGVMIALGAALGSFGSALTKTPNYAAQIIQNALDRDFDAQRGVVRAKGEQISVAQHMFAQFRAAGMDDQAAKAATFSVVMQHYANKVDSIMSTKKGESERAAGQAVADALRMQGMELAAASAAAAARRGRKPTDILKLQQEAELRQGQIDKTRAEAGKTQAEATGGGASDATLNRRSKLATEYQTLMSGVEDIDHMLQLVRSGRVGPVGATVPLSKDAQDFDSRRTSAVEKLARSFGGPTTDSDRQAARMIQEGSIPKLTAAQWIDRLENLRRHAIERRDRALRGQDPADVRAITQNAGAGPVTTTPTSTADYAGRFGGHQ